MATHEDQLHLEARPQNLVSFIPESTIFNVIAPRLVDTSPSHFSESFEQVVLQQVYMWVWVVDSQQHLL